MAMLNYQRVEDWFHRNIRRIRGRNVRMTRSLKLGPFRNVVFMRPPKGPQSAREVLNSPSLEHLETSRPSPAHSPSASRCWRFQRALQTLPTDPWRGEHSKPRTWAGYIYPIYPIHVESIELPWTTHPIQVASGLPGWQHDTLCDASPAPQTRATPPGLPGQKRSSLFQPLEVCDQFSSSWARTLLTSVNSQCADCFRKLKRLKSLRIPNGIRYTVVQDYFNWKKIINPCHRPCPLGIFPLPMPFGMIWSILQWLGDMAGTMPWPWPCHDRGWKDWLYHITTLPHCGCPPRIAAARLASQAPWDHPSKGTAGSSFHWWLSKARKAVAPTSLAKKITGFERKKYEEIDPKTYGAEDPNSFWKWCHPVVFCAVAGYHWLILSTVLISSQYKPVVCSSSSRTKLTNSRWSSAGQIWRLQMHLGPASTWV